MPLSNSCMRARLFLFKIADITHYSLLSEEDVEGGKILFPGIVCSRPSLRIAHFNLYSPLSHLRRHLNQVVKVSASHGADDALDVVWEAGVVCLVVDILNLEELVTDLTRKDKEWVGKPDNEQQIDFESPVPAKVWGRFQSPGCTAVPG